jgi:hypothetical protein
MLLPISFKYSYFKLVFNYTRKGLWKGILIRQNCDTLVCFRPVALLLHLNKNVFQDQMINNLSLQS